MDRRPGSAPNATPQAEPRTERWQDCATSSDALPWRCRYARRGRRSPAGGNPALYRSRRPPEMCLTLSDTHSLRGRPACPSAKSSPTAPYPVGASAAHGPARRSRTVRAVLTERLEGGGRDRRAVGVSGLVMWLGDDVCRFRLGSARRGAAPRPTGLSGQRGTRHRVTCGCLRARWGVTPVQCRWLLDSRSLKGARAGADTPGDPG